MQHTTTVDPTSAVEHGVRRAASLLQSLQDPAGFWCGELEGDTILESETILLWAWLGEEQTELARQCGDYLLEKQEPHGGWALFPGGPLDVSVSVKAYFALKLVGENPESPAMQKAREAIRAAGGADRVNSFTRFYLALLGQISYDHCPAVPPEAMLLPSWAPVNIYRVSAWSRTIFVPLSIVWAHRPVKQLPADRGVEELFLKPSDQWPPLRRPGAEEHEPIASWPWLFRKLDGALQWLERCRLTPLRGASLRMAEQWMTDRFVASDGLGAIYPPIVWSAIALRCLGYAESSPEVQYCREQLEALVIRDGDTARLQPCKSPVWDTTIALRALAAAKDEDAAPSIERGVGWLLSKECRRHGDWSTRVACEPGGWYFEFNNDFYPDADDTAMALLALRESLDLEAVHDVAIAGGKVGNLAAARRRAETIDRTNDACRRAVAWLRAMQNSDGGWGAFDKDNDAEFLCHVPFADHNAMIDPSTPDLAARVVESLAAWGARIGEPTIDRAVAYLRQTQQEDGAWFGRWGVNYVYGTWQTLVGLAAVGVSTDDKAVRRGARWLADHQNDDGGWGESIDTYEDPSLRGQGESTASQTAWAVLGIIAAGEGETEAVSRGVQWLLDRQRDDGGWDEPQFTGTGFPRVFYLKYHLYSLYFPLLALAQYRDATHAGAASQPAANRLTRRT